MQTKIRVELNTPILESILPCVIMAVVTYKNNRNMRFTLHRVMT